MPEERKKQVKLDYDLLRYILFEIEDENYSRGAGENLQNELRNKYGDKFEQIKFAHIELLNDGGYIVANVKRFGDNLLFVEPLRITLKGYDFLNSIRDVKQWQNIKNKIYGIGSYSLEVIKQVATKLILEQI